MSRSFRVANQGFFVAGGMTLFVRSPWPMPDAVIWTDRVICRHAPGIAPPHVAPLKSVASGGAAVKMADRVGLEPTFADLQATSRKLESFQL